MTDESILTEKFGPVLTESPDLLAECKALMKIFSLSAEELSYKWESYALRESDRDGNLKIDLDALDDFRRHLQAHFEKESQDALRKKHSNATPIRPIFLNTPKSEDSLFDSVMNMTGSLKRKKATILTTPQTPSKMRVSENLSSSPLQQRSGEQNEILETLNGDIHSSDGESQSTASKVSISANMYLKKFQFPTMYQKLAEAAEYLDEQLESFTQIIQQTYDIPDEKFGDPSQFSPEEIVAVGRIVPESSIDDKLNLKSIMLETSRRISAGNRVPIKIKLDLKTDMSLFPGQIVAFAGVNASGSEFTVSKSYDLPLLPMPASSRSELEELSSNKKWTKVLSASGPYTSCENLDFEPLDNLINTINDQLPDCVVLLGPFLDSNHIKTRTGDFQLSDPEADSTLDNLFKEKISRRLRRINSDVVVIVIPSVNDTASNHAVFPQRALDRHALDLPKNFKCLSNPATFSINGMVFSATSADPLRGLTSKQIIVRATNSDPSQSQTALSLACEHILRQRTVYPVFPPPFVGDEVLSVDIPYLGLAEFGSVLPDVFITPYSRHIARVVQGVVVISPGAVCRRAKGGTFATMLIKAPILDQQEEQSHKVWQRARVDIIKI